MRYWLAAFYILFSLSAVSEETGGTSASQQIQLPVYYPESFESRGVIQAIGRVDRRTAITVDGTRYHLAAGAKIHFLSQREGPIHKLEKGMGVGFRLVKARDGKRIAEIWELPAALTPGPS